MTHIETEALAMIALGDTPPTAGDEAHLAVCSHCAAELSSLDRVVRLGRSSGHLEVVPPPSSVWAGIQADLGLMDYPAMSTPDQGATPARTGEPAAEPETSRARRTSDSPSPATPRSRAPRRGRKRTLQGPVRRRWLPVAAGALAVGLVVGAGFGVWWQSDRDAPTAVVVADATLEAFPNWPGAAGTAVVDERPGGLRQVSVTVDEAAETGPGLREVWLIRIDGSGLISIGYLAGSEGRFDVPPGLDLADYALVDVSAERDDGDPAHSGDSIVRGQLQLS